VRAPLDSDTRLMANRPWITARDLHANPDLEIPADATLTPLARDLVRARGQEPRRADSAGARREALVVANWKSHKTRAEARAFAAGLAQAQATHGVQLVVCPPFTALDTLGAALAEEGLAVELGAQDVSPHGEGAHTGEVAARHLVEVGCRWVIVGHSERRYAGEDDALVARKLRVSLDAELQPILCVGETLEERKAGRAESVVSRQLEVALAGVSAGEVGRLALAYEPRWAIGTGLTPTGTEVTELLQHIRRRLVAQLGEGGAAPAVLYGGSVKPKNAAELMGLPGCGGALIGGAALDPVAFAAIAAAC